MEELDQAFGPWLRASPLPKFTDDVKRETSSGTCSKNLFSPSSLSKCVSTEKGKAIEGEVNQQAKPPIVTTEVGDLETPIGKLASKVIEENVESFGTVAISGKIHPGEKAGVKVSPKTHKWTRKRVSKTPVKYEDGRKWLELGKRTMVDGGIVEGNGREERGMMKKKSKGDVMMVDLDNNNKNCEVVLDDQHRRTQ